MKKAYSKPEIMFESFISSTNIAGCGVDTNLPSKDVCGIPQGPGVTLFMEGISGCSVNVKDGDNNVCYHNPTDTNMLFGS